ncbi:MAG: hypothetical protein SOT07_06600 [Paludibacteraceae bacterium]|nr:hypothetical protein [Paludibacteraceae bacterium]
MEKKIITLTEGELKTQIIVLKENSKEEFRLKCKKATNENEDVMKKYWNINRKGNYAPILLEKITIDRLMKKHGDNGFIIISANRSDESEEYNVQKTQELITDLKLSKYSYLPVYGGRKGKDGVDNYEPSFIVFNYDKNGNPKNWEQLRSLAIKLCSTYAQDSVFVQGPNESPIYLDADGKKTDSSANHISFTSDIVSSEIYINPMPGTITERMRREGEILLY